MPLYDSEIRDASTCAKPPLNGALPAAISTRPQFASRPKSAVLTSGEVAIRCAIARASAVLAAPATLISATSVAPSPSTTICDERSRQTVRSASANDVSVAGERSIGAAPDESSTTASFVEHSPSTEIALKLSATTGRRNEIASPAASG